MARTDAGIHYLTDAVNVKYSLNNLWDCELDFIAPYLQDFRVDRYAYRLVNYGQLVSPSLIGLGNHWDILEETVPFGRIHSELLWKTRAKSYLNRLKYTGNPVCCLMDWCRMQDAYFHWLFDILPRALAASDFQQKTKSKVGLLVPSEMKQWQIDSLLQLGFHPECFVPVNRDDIRTSIASEALLVAPSARVQCKESALYGCMNPGLVRQLADKLTKSLRVLRIGIEKQKKIYISRADAQSRRILNEEMVIKVLESCGFSVFCLAHMTFTEQVELFSSASHIVGAHGGGLSNLLFSTHASVLELFADGHGLRTEYFQLSSLNSLSYYYYVFASINEANDFVVDLSVLEIFINATC